MLVMATRAFTRGFCAYVISAKISLTGVTLCIRMGSSFLASYMYDTFEIVHCTCLGCQLIFKKIFYFLSEYHFTFINGVNPDEMQHIAAFHLGLHCSQNTR